jgi:hypothetical protein
MGAKAYGTVSPEQQKAMSGLEFVRGLANGELPLNTIAQTLGYDVVEADSGRVVITVDPTDAHLNKLALIAMVVVLSKVWPQRSCALAVNRVGLVCRAGN